MSGPSDWDSQLVAAVPFNEINLWVSDNMQLTQPGDWPQRVASEIDVSGIKQWYQGGGKVVGLDRKNSLVVYRVNTMGN